MNRVGQVSWLHKSALANVAVCLVFFFACGVDVRAAEFSADFEAANKLYEQGKFSEAATAYDKLIANKKVSPALYFNRGNAFFKMNQIGRAIASYREAEQLSPRDPDVRANLQFARDQVSGNATIHPPLWQTWLRRLTLNEWTRMAAWTFWILFALLAVVEWHPELKRNLRNYIFATGGITLLLGIGLVWSLTDYYLAKPAIVIVREAIVRNGPLDESQTAFTAHDGAELAVLDAKGDWLQVSDSQRVGWLRRDAVLPQGASAKKSILQQQAAD